LKKNFVCQSADSDDISTSHRVLILRCPQSGKEINEERIRVGDRGAETERSESVLEVKVCSKGMNGQLNSL
jgi:hypothetical protein